MFSFYQNTLQEVFNQNIEEYCSNSAYASDVHSSINFGKKLSGQKSMQGTLNGKKLNPLGTGRPWSKVEQDIVSTFNDFSKEYIRQIDLHFKTFNKHLTKETVDLTVQQNPEKKKQYQRFVAREEMLFWQDFPRNKKFYHSYLRKIYTLFNQCKMPENLIQDLDSQTNPDEVQQKQMCYIRDIQLIIALCLDMMPQASQEYTDRIESPSSQLIQNVWELTDYYTQTVISPNESQEHDENLSPANEGGEKKNRSGNASSHGETILSGGHIISYIGSLGGLEGAKDISMDKEARHLRKYLYQNRRKFDNIVEDISMFDADNLKNWAILGNLITIMVTDVMQIFLSTQENLKISLGLVEALMTYSSFYSKSYHTIEIVDVDIRTIFDVHQNQIQYQWAQLFGQISKLSPITFDNCLNFLNQALITDHKMRKLSEIEDLAEQIYHSRFLDIQPMIVDQSLLASSPSYKAQVMKQSQAQLKKANQVITMFSEMTSYLNSSKISEKFKIVLLKTLRHLIAQLNFRDSEILQNSKELNFIWQNGIQLVFQFVDKVMISKVFPDVGSINLKKKVGSGHWDALLESPFNQQVLCLIIQIIKVSEESFYNDALVRLMNWICLNQMLENKKSFDFASRILIELFTPELYKVQEFMIWQPKLVNHIYFLQDTDRNFCTPIVSHTDLQIINQMPHRSPGLLNNKNTNLLYQLNSNHSKYGISFNETFSTIFDRKNMECSGKQGMPQQISVKFFHAQYLELMAIYDIQFLQETVFPQFLLNVDDESLFSQEMILLCLQEASKILDPSLNFRQKYLTVHEQYSNQKEFLNAQIAIFDDSILKIRNLMENAITLIIQSPIFTGKFIQDSMNFFLSSQYKELCSDSMGIIWPSPSLSVMKESEYVSKFLQKCGFAKFLIEINKSEVTFEDHAELMSHFLEQEAYDPYAEADEKEFRYDDFFVIPNEQFDDSKEKDRFNRSFEKPEQYLNNDMNKIISGIQKEIGLQWDKKKESYTRHRLMSYLMEDRSTKPKSDKAPKIPKESWLNDTNQITQKQKNQLHGENLCPKRKIQVDIRVQILKMLHYLPSVFDNEFVSQNLCKDLMQNGDKLELTDQCDRITRKLKLTDEESILDKSKVMDCNLPVINQLDLKLSSISYPYYKKLYTKHEDPSVDHLGGTLRLGMNKMREYDRLKNIQINVLSYGLLCTDYEVSSKTSKLIQKMLIFGNIETKVCLIDQIIYMIKELMIDQSEEFHLQMLLQQLVSCIQIWHHSEIHKLRMNNSDQIYEGFQFVRVNSFQGSQLEDKTYPEIHQYLYIFDMLDAISLIGICNKEKMVRCLSLSLLQDSSKLKRLIAGHCPDQKKSLADLLYYNELAIKDNIIDRMTLLKMFKFRNVKTDVECDSFTKTYSREDIETILQNLSFYKIIEDNFDYKLSKINESLARDIQVQYVGELATLWKNELKVLMTNKKSKTPQDSTFRKSKKLQRVICQRLLNFIFNISRRSVAIFEQKTESRQELVRKPSLNSKIITQSKDYVGMNILNAITLYGVTVSSFNQLEPFYDQIDDILQGDIDSEDEGEQDQKNFRLSTMQEELFNIIALSKQELIDFHKVSAGSGILPAKIPISSLILCLQYIIQSPLPLALSNQRAQMVMEQGRQIQTSKSNRPIKQSSTFTDYSTKADVQQIYNLQFIVLQEIFAKNLSLENEDQIYQMNCVFFHCLIFSGTDQCDGETLQSELKNLIEKQSNAKNLKFCENLLLMVEIAEQYLQNQRQMQAADIIKAILFNGVTKIVKIVMNKSQDDIEGFLPLERQVKIINFCQQNTLSGSQDWLIHKNRQSYSIILQYQHFLSQNHNRAQIQLDLQYLINMQNLGYDVLKYFILEQNGFAQKEGLSEKEQMVQGVNEIKLMINSVYQFYTAQEDINQLLQNVNPFYECFLYQIIPNEVEKQKFMDFLTENRFSQAYEKLTKATFNIKYSSKSRGILIDKQVRKFVQYNIHSKIFLMTLSMSLNLKSSGDQDQISQIERSRLICLATLPLMFDDEEFREQVEEKVSRMPDIQQIIKYDNRDFYRLIKMMIQDEEQYNLHNHFEKYFAISGFVRNLLNEIIKLQSQNDSKIYSSNQMLIRILDTLTYFMSQKEGKGLQLRRAPRSNQEQSTFLFDNMIDYKSFEFLAKLFKITEKLIEYDQNMTIMNMWFKLVENQRQNYEILAKFLIHNLGSYMTKLKQQANSPNLSLKVQIQMQDEAMYSIEFDKCKRYSINIFNYIKARVQRADIRNSIQVSAESPCWAKKMIELLLQAQLNVQSKYVLEKVKLKKILQTMHREINQSDQALKLKGGIDTEILVMQFQQLGKDDVQQSIRMSQLLESQTFLNAFSSNKRKEKSILDNLLFNFQRIIKEKFVKITPVSQLNQFNDLLIKYFENSLVFIANDTDRQLQLIKFTKEQELIVIVVILVLIGHLMMQYSEQRYKYLIDIFKNLQANMLASNQQPYFHLNTLSPKQLQFDSSKNGGQSKQNQFSQKILAMFNYKQTLFDCFDLFTKTFFTITNNISSDSELRVNMMELYQQIFRGLREFQRQKLQNQEEEYDEISEPFQREPALSLNSSVHLMQNSKNLRQTVLAMLQSAFFNLHELSSIQNKLVSVSQTSSLTQQAQQETKIVYNLSKNFRQHISNMIDYILYSYELDRLKKEQQQRKTVNSMSINNNDILGRDISASTKAILFAQNTLFWVGVACLEAPMHMVQSEANSENPYLMQIYQIQYVGMVAIRKTLEETNYLKILHVFQNLSDIFYSYNLQMGCDRTSFMNILLNSMRNPLCVRDALKMLILTIRIQDPKLLVGKSQPDLDNLSSQEQVIGRVELIRLLYLLPFFMQQFLDPSPVHDQLFQNKKNMIQLLKKSLPSIGINKKSEIFQKLEEIQKITSNDQFDAIELENSFESLIKQTIDLIYQQGLQGSLADVYRTFKLLNEYSKNNDLPIKGKILQMMIDYLKQMFQNEDIQKLINEIQEKSVSNSLFNQSTEILGEETDNYRHEFKALYFGMKNIITKEIECLDKEIEVSQFFDKEAVGTISLQQSTQSTKSKKIASTTVSNQSQNQRFLQIQKAIHSGNPKNTITTTTANSVHKTRDSLNFAAASSQQQVQKRQSETITWSKKKPIYQETEEKKYTNSPSRRSKSSNSKRSRSKSQTRYVDETDDLDQVIEIRGVPSQQQRILFQKPAQSVKILAQETIPDQENFQQNQPSQSVRSFADQTQQSIKSFADLAQEQRRAQTSQEPEYEMLTFQKAPAENEGITFQRQRAATVVEDMTFQKKTEHSKTMGMVYEEELELPGSQYEEVQSYQQPKLEEIKQQQASEISSRDHRRFYQAPINPLDNESNNTSAQSLRPRTAQIARKPAKEVSRPQTVSIRPQTSIKQVPHALQPNFVADKSNQIWSDVASQKSQNLQQQPQPDYLEENSQIIDQINKRTTESMKSFTQLTQQQKYSKNEPNFEFK